MTNNINRIKAVLAETGHTGKWLAVQVERDPATVSKWCTNTVQPDRAQLELQAISLYVLSLLKLL